jgi:2',3'-cyclic-nucleotide 2'-phosphodiesterase/3'-nucleotidase/5'-nucleotidase
MRFIATATVLGLATLPAIAGVEDSRFRLDFTPLGSYSTFLFDEGGCEIVQFDAATQRLYVVNGGNERIDVLDTNAAGDLTFAFSIDISAYGAGIQSIGISNGVIGAAISAPVDTDPGVAAFFDLDGNPLGSVQTGVLPDMIGCSDDGRYWVTADEGQPNDAYDIDPVGGVTVIEFTKKGPSARVITFETVDPAVVEGPIVLSGPNADFAADLEPEYIAFSSDSTRAYVSCQEANCVAILDLASGEWLSVKGIGFKDHSLPGNELDASNKDDSINIRNWPIFGIHMPDTVARFTIDGVDYIATANEGDGRDYGGYSNETRVKDVTLDPTAFPDAADLQAQANLGRIKIDASQGDIDGDGDYDALYSFGARSMSILDAAGNLIADTGSVMEEVIATLLPDNFNSTNDENDTFDDRSDDKGPEPEGITVGVIDGRTVAFVGLERIGGVMAFDVSDPTNPVYAGYVNTRDFAGDPLAFTAGDLGPEGLDFIAASDSPTGKPMIAVGFEISGTARLFEIGDACEGDVNGDGIIDSGDLGLILGFWGACTDPVCATDVNGDGFTDKADISVILANWGSCADAG